MKKVLPFALLVICFIACEPSPETKEREKKKAELKAAYISEHTIDKDSLVKDIMKDVMMDTIGIWNAPIKVISAKMVKKEYSNYRDIALSYKNVSGKTVTAIKFRWYGLNAFGDPADMGAASSISPGFGGGFSETTTRPGKMGYGEWEILSRDGKKVVLAWPTEVAFSDGTKWKTGKK